ncbi:MAG: hypothetical protein J7502_08080 [Flavisolibacter sp.]|nr:hypothetical protein [Flavisolibacter sp.]
MRLLAVFLQLVGFCTAYSQLPLNFQSYAIKLSVSKDQKFVLATKAGEVGTATGLYDTWQRIDPRSKELFGPTLEGSYFFNKDTGFVYGFIGNEKATKYNFIYHSTNGGRNWKMLDFGQSGWVDDACALDNGEAWLSVAGSGIAYTSDYGFHWNKIDIPDTKQRFASVFFNANHQGIIASLWNLMAYTTDNGSSWKYLPTPLDQKKYNKTNKSSRPEFSRVALFGNYIIAKQEDFVFYTPIDSINWIPLSNFIDFFTDGDNTALFFKTNKNTFVRSDSNFQVLHSLESDLSAYDARCKNGNLFILTASGIVELKPDNNIVKASFQTAGSETIEPYNFGYNANGFIGVRDNKIFLQKEYRGNWTYQFTLPFDVDNKGLSTWNNSILYQKGDSVFYFSLSGKMMRSTSKKQMLEDFCKAGIAQITFHRGSSGCFHSFRDVLTYSRKPDGFGLPVEQNAGSKHQEQLPENEDEISFTSVDNFLKKIPAFFETSQMSSIQDLGFTESDYQQCKKDILEFKQSLEQPEKTTKKKASKEKSTAFYFARNNLDFDRLLNMVDSIKHIDTTPLNSILLDLSEMWSTTTNFTGFSLINSKNEELSFQSSYYEPNAFYFPWTISLNGCVVTSTSMNINNFIKEVYPKFLDEKNKVAVLHTIVKRLY